MKDRLEDNFVYFQMIQMMRELDSLYKVVDNALEGI